MHSKRYDQPKQKSKFLFALLFVLIAAFIGSMIWTLLLLFIGFENPLVAVFLGSCVGLAGALPQKPSQKIAYTCGFISVLSILFAKLVIIALLAALELPNDNQLIDLSETNQPIIRKTLHYADRISADPILDSYFKESLDRSKTGYSDVDWYYQNIEDSVKELKDIQASFPRRIRIQFKSELIDEADRISYIGLLFRNFTVWDFVSFALAFLAAYKIASGAGIVRNY